MLSMYLTVEMWEMFMNLATQSDGEQPVDFVWMTRE